MRVYVGGCWKDTSSKFARDYVKHLQRTGKKKEIIEKNYLSGVTIAELFRKGKRYV